jgi:hypothetical protein
MSLPEKVIKRHEKMADAYNAANAGMSNDVRQAFIEGATHEALRSQRLLKWLREIELCRDPFLVRDIANRAVAEYDNPSMTHLIPHEPEIKTSHTPPAQ